MKLSNVKIITPEELKTLHVHPFQRNIKAIKVKQYMDSIRENGFWKSHPIVYFVYNGKRIIIWGHHRREACLALKCSGYAAEMQDVTKEESIDLIKAENWATWKIGETVALEVRRGNPDYIQMMEYVKLGMSVAAASSLLSGDSASSANYMKHVKTGDFKVKTTENADKIAAVLAKFPNNKIIRNVNFIKALSRCLFVPQFDCAAFAKKLGTHPGELENRSTIPEFTDIIAGIYNKAARSPIPLRFLADQAAKEREFGGRNKK
jgi:hypothetical protein